MSKVGKNGQEQSIERKYTEKTVNEWTVIEEEQKQLVTKAKEPEKVGVAAVIKSRDYFERMLKNSIDQNLALRVRADETLDQAGWANIVYGKGCLQEKLPVATKDKKFGSSEKDAIKDARKTFRNADLCTIREQLRMKDYLAMEAKRQESIGEDGPQNQDLKDYVNSLLKVKLSPAIFTDDYLSTHIHELYDYSTKLARYGELKKRYPKFFSGLSMEKQMTLESASEMAPELKALLIQHLDLHGVVIEDTIKGKRVSLRTEPKEKEKRHAERASKKELYDQSLRKFYIKNVVEEDLRLGEKLAQQGMLNSAGTLAALEEKINSKAEMKELFAPEIAGVMEEVRKGLEVRNQLLEKLDGFVKEYREGGDQKKKMDAGISIRRMNRKILLASRHVDRYMDFISFLAGEVKRLPAATAEFFLAEKHQDLVEIIDFKMSADFLKDSLVLNKVVPKEVELEECRREKAKKGAKKDEKKARETDQKIVKLEKEIQKEAVYESLPLTAYYAQFRDYRKAGEKNKEIRAKVQEFEAKKQSAWEKGEKLAKEYGLTQRGGDRIFGSLRGTFRDMEEVGDGGDLTFMYLATQYKPGPDTTSEQKRMIIEKGIKPILKRILAKDGKALKAMDFEGEPDYPNAEFWENESLVRIGFVQDFFLHILKNYDVSLKDEEYDHILAFSKTAQLIQFKYANVTDDAMADPKLVLFKNEELQKNMNGLIYNVYQDYMGLGVNKLTPEMKKVQKRYSKKRLGFDAKDTDLSGNTLSVPICNKMSSLAGMAVGDVVRKGADLEEEFNKELARIRAKNPLEEERENERKRMLSYFPNYGEKELEIRLALKRYGRDVENRISDVQRKHWVKAMGSVSGDGSDTRSFQLLLLPVKTDKNGSTSPESRKNKEYNDRMIDDYISGDEKRRNRVLFRIAKDMLKIRFTPEMLTYEYMKEHYLELHDTLERIHGFQNIWTEYPDFFESNVFTEEERDYLRQNFIDSTTITRFLNITGFYVRTLGIEDSGKESQASEADEKTEESRKAWGRTQAEIMEMTARALYEDEKEGMAAELAKDARRKALYETKGKEIRKVSVLYTKRRAELARIRRGITIEIHNLASEKDPLVKEKKKKELDERDAERIRELEGQIRALKEIKEYLYEEKKEISPEAKLISYEYDLELFPGGEINQARADLNMSIDMDLEEESSGPKISQMTEAEEIQHSRELEEAQRQRKEWEEELRKENLELGIAPEEELVLTVQERKLMSGRRALPKELFAKLVQMEKKKLLTEQDRQVLFATNRMDDILDPEHYWEREKEWEAMDLKETVEIPLNEEIDPKLLEGMDEETRSWVLKSREEERKKAEEERRKKEKEQEETERTQEAAALQAMSNEELFEYIGEQEAIGKETDMSFAELAKRLQVSAEEAKEGYRRVVEREKNKEKKENGSIDLTGLNLSDSLMKDLAETQGMTLEELKEKSQKKETQKKEEKSSKSNPLVLSYEIIKVLADVEGMSVEDYKKKEGILAKEEVEKAETEEAAEKEEEEKEEKAIDFVSMDESEILAYIDERGEAGAEAAFAELAKRLKVPVDLVKEQYRILPKKEEKKEKENGGLGDLSGLNLSDSLMKDMAELQGISLEEFKKQNHVGERKEVKKETSSPEGLVLSDEIIKDLADMEGISVEDYKKREGIRSKEEVEKAGKVSIAEDEQRIRERGYIENTDITRLSPDMAADYRKRETAEAGKLYEEALKKREGEGSLDSDEVLFVFNKKKYINPDASSFVKEFAENAEFAQKKHLPEDYPDPVKEQMIQVIKEAGYDVPEEQDDFSEIVGKNAESMYWVEEGKIKSESLWKRDLPESVRQAYNWLRGYFRAHDMGARLDDGEIPQLEIPNYKVYVRYEPALMELQGSNNCWCCAGSAIYNQMLIHKRLEEARKKGQKGVNIQRAELCDQYQIRGYEPEYKDYDEMNAKFKGKLDKELFDADVEKTKNYAGLSKDAIGNIFEMADFFLDKSKEHDFILNRMVFNIPDMEDLGKVDRNFRVYNNMKAQFLKQVKEVLDSKNLVACLSHDSSGLAHYRTITGIDGERIRYYDSGSKSEHTGSWETFLNTDSHIPTELTWFSPMKKPEELTAEYSNLTYDSKKGFDVKSFRAEGALNVAQTKGVCVGADARKMGEGMDGIERAVYIPNDARA